MSPLRPADLFDDDAPLDDATQPELSAPRSPTASAPRRKKANDHKVRDVFVQHAHQAPVTDKMVGRPPFASQAMHEELSNIADKKFNDEK